MGSSKPRPRLPRWPVSAGIGVVAWGALAVLFLAGTLKDFDLKLLDSKFRVRGERTAASSIAVVGIDDATIKADGPWPLNRDMYVFAIEALLQGGASAIAVDLTLEPKPGQNNEDLAHISGESDRVVHVLWAPTESAESSPPADEESEFALLRFGIPCSAKLIGDSNPIYTPYPALLRSMRRAGAVMIWDDDGAYRRIPPFIGHAGRCLPTLALAAQAASRGDSIVGLTGIGDQVTIQWASKTNTMLPLDDEGTVGIDFAGGESAFPQTTSMCTVLQWYRDRNVHNLRAAFSGKIVLIGLTAPGYSDIGATPFDPSTPGVYAHANLLDDLIRGRVLRRVPPTSYLLVLLLLSIGAALAISSRGLWPGALIAGLVMIGVIAAIQAALALWAVEVPTVMAGGLMPLVFLLSASHRVLFLERGAQVREAEIRQGFVLQQEFLPDALLGKQISVYRIEERLGGGGMGLVFRATAVDSGKTVAIKFLPGAENAPESLRRRFRHEALVLARLNHPNVARMIEYGSRNGIDFLAMEYVPGMSLSERIREGIVPEDEAVAIGIQICAGLAAAHDRGILHRDLKPANVMLSGSGRVKLVDFGIARFTEAGTSIPTLTPLTESGHVVGTPLYLAPEVIRGQEADRRTDIYGVGMILYEMVTGRWPYPPCSREQIFWTIENAPPLPMADRGARISRELETVILGCLSKSPDQRSKSIAGLESLLAGALIARESI